jgi:hypothetical protein
MKAIVKQTVFRQISPALIFLATFSLNEKSEGQIEGFNESFSESLDLFIWRQQGEFDSHQGVTDGSYIFTDQFGAPGTKLTRSTGGFLSGSFRHEVEVLLDPFRLDSNPGTGSDFKMKMFGPDGFMEIVLNSFGNMRLFHNDFSGGGGNLQPQTNIGIVDGDVLKLVIDYDFDADEIEATYSLNGGDSVPFYAGSGIDGRIGDVVTNFVEVELFKFNDQNASAPVAAINEWNVGGETSPAGPSALALTNIDYDPVADTFRFSWNSEPGKVYGIFWSLDLINWDADLADNVFAEGTTTTYPPLFISAEPNPGTSQGTRPEAIFFRVEEIPLP